VLFTVRRSQDRCPATGSDAGQPEAQDNAVKVVVRVRPFSAAEAGEKEALAQRSTQTLAVASPTGEKEKEKEAVFSFDYVFGAATSQVWFVLDGRAIASSVFQCMLFAVMLPVKATVCKHGSDGEDHANFAKY